MKRGAGWAAIHGVAKGQTQLSIREQRREKGRLQSPGVSAIGLDHRGTNRGRVILLHSFTLVWMPSLYRDQVFSSLAFPEIVSAMHELV